MANFDSSRLSPADQSAFAAWQQRLRGYVASNRGAVPAELTYALQHPDYLQQHPELQEAYNLVSGAELPGSIRTQLQSYHPTWGHGAGMAENTGLWDKWETWLQLGLGAGLGGVAAAGLTGAGAAGGSGAAASGGSMPAVGVAPFSGLPGGIGAGVGSAGWGAGAAGAAGAAGSIPGWLDTVLKAAPVGAGLINHFASGDGPGGGGGAGGNMPPELSELLALSMKRMRDQEPLFQSVTKQALAGLPTYAQGK